MSKKLLMNCITFDDGNLIPLLYKCEYFLNNDVSIAFYGPKSVENRIRSFGKISSFENVSFIEVKNASKIYGKFQLILEGFKRNLLGLSEFKKYSSDFDVVYSISSVLDMILMPFCLKLLNPKIRWVTVFDNTVPLFSNGHIISGNKLVRILAWAFYRVSLLLLKRADVVFVVKSELKDILQKEGISSDKLVVTGNGVEIDLIKTAKKLPDLAFDALFIGRINEAKGIYDMLEVLKIITPTIPTFKLAIMGGGDTATVTKYKEEITASGLNKNVEFLGYVTGQKKYDILKSSKCFLFLSETESLPQVVMEAVSSGLPTFVYNLDCYSMYKNNELMIFALRDYKSVAKKMLELFETREFVNVQGMKLLDTFSWDRIAGIELASINLN